MHPATGTPPTATWTEPSPYPGVSSAAGSDGSSAPEGERSWTEQWNDGSWSVPAVTDVPEALPMTDVPGVPSGSVTAPDPDMEPATSPTPTSPPLSRVTPSPVRRSPEPIAPEPAPRHRLDLPERPETGPASVSGDGLDSRLTPNEQELLRRLQEELAARESGGGESPQAPPRNGSIYPESPSA